MESSAGRILAGAMLLSAAVVAGLSGLPGRAQTPAATTRVRIEKAVVFKAQRRMELIQKGKVWKSYRVALGGNPVGHKMQRGDGRTPEGIYVLDRRNPRSQFHRSIHISYPNSADRASARRRGVSPGGDIFLHGLPNGMGAVGAAHTMRDWTDGCIAVTNEEIEEIWKVVPNGTPIEIRP